MRLAESPFFTFFLSAEESLPLFFGSYPQVDSFIPFENALLQTEIIPKAETIAHSFPKEASTPKFKTRQGDSYEDCHHHLRFPL